MVKEAFVILVGDPRTHPPKGMAYFMPRWGAPGKIVVYMKVK